MESFTPKPVKPEVPAGAASEKKQLEGGVVYNLKQIFPLVVALVVFKWLIADIFIIPSGSMEPTLHGRENSGDRIFSTKFDFRFRKPHRWEVFVFKFPYEEGVRHRQALRFSSEGMEQFKGENFIKRCVGLPDEELAIIDGDIFTRKHAGETARREVKPDKIQRNLWIPVYRENFSGLTPAELALSWPGAEARGVTIAGARLQIAASDWLTLNFQPRDRYGIVRNVRDRYVRRQTVTYTCPQCGHKVRQSVARPQFFARCGHCRKYLTEEAVTYYDFRADYPVPDNPPGGMTGDPSPRLHRWYNVPDLRWRGKVRFTAPGGKIRILLTRDNSCATAEFAVGANGTGTVRFYLDKREIPAGRADFSVAADQERELEFYLCDGEYRAFIDRQPLFSLAPGGHAAPANHRYICQKSGIALQLQGKMEFSHFSVDRDIYYFPRHHNYPFFRLEAGEYLALGDHCSSSNDSRDWGVVPEKNLVGPAWFVWWPLEAIRIIH